MLFVNINAIKSAILGVNYQLFAIIFIFYSKLAAVYYLLNLGIFIKQELSQSTF